MRGAKPYQPRPTDEWSGRTDPSRTSSIEIVRTPVLDATRTPPRTPWLPGNFTVQPDNVKLQRTTTEGKGWTPAARGDRVTLRGDLSRHHDEAGPSRRGGRSRTRSRN